MENLRNLSEWSETTWWANNVKQSLTDEDVNALMDGLHTSLRQQTGHIYFEPTSNHLVVVLSTETAGQKVYSTTLDEAEMKTVMEMVKTNKKAAAEL